MNQHGRGWTGKTETSVLSVELRRRFVGKGVPQFSPMVNHCADNVLTASFDCLELSVRMFLRIGFPPPPDAVQ